MKLWLVSQWGNALEGGNGADTNCVVRAATFDDALRIAGFEFERWISRGWKTKQCDRVIELGSTKGSECCIVYPWLAHVVGPGLIECKRWSYYWNHVETDGQWLSDDERDKRDSHQQDPDNFAKPIPS